MEELARKYTDAETFAHFSGALEKIKTKLRDYQLEDVEELQHNVKAYINEDFTPKYLSTADKACHQIEVLKITYLDNREKQTERKIEPIGLTFYSQNWHLIAYCRLRKDFRDFVLSRIQKIKVTGENFTPRLSLEGYITKLRKV